MDCDVDGSKTKVKSACLQIWNVIEAPMVMKLWMMRKLVAFSMLFDGGDVRSVVIMLAGGDVQW